MNNWLLRHTSTMMVMAFAVIFLVRFSSVPNFISSLTPENIYQLTLDIRFEPDNEIINIETYIPIANERQQIIEEQFVNNGLGNLIKEDGSGRIVQWNGDSLHNSVQYRVLLRTQETQYQINPDIVIPQKYPESLESFLQETESIQVNHPEITQLWKNISPKSSGQFIPTVKAIYDYTYQEISGAPFKGFTDAVTALRLKQASCNGKSRLFVALARLNNIPARLVGGIILNQGSKKTSHQWVEVFVEGHWIPFGPTNGNFASLPANYISLYTMDKFLFKHTGDINFDYLFSTDKRLVASSLYQAELLDSDDIKQGSSINISQLLLVMGLAPQTIGLFLLFPLCTFAITFLRNVVGIKTFGIFMPMLIAAACVFTGFFRGVSAFVVILSISFFAHVLLDKMQMLKIARLAAIITVNTLFIIIGLNIIGSQTNLEFGMLSLFPVVIISFVAEKIHDMSNDNNWSGLVLVSLGTLLSIWLCYLILSSFLLEGLFSFYPEFYLLVLAAQIYIGQWTGLRFSELYRFRTILGDDDNPVIGINERNRGLILARNDKKLLKLAADKLATKTQLEKFNIPIPGTLLKIENLAKLSLLDEFLVNIKQFALKPNQGSQGNGILIIVDRIGECFITANGKQKTFLDIRKQCSDIISGTYSQTGDEDIAYFEPLLIQHDLLQNLAPFGLSDIRVIISQGKVVSAMLRMPTKESDGKANLHQRAVGIAINISTGITTNASIKGKVVERHPDNDNLLIGIQLPFWKQIVKMSTLCQQAITLGYMGVDICIDKDIGPLVLEVNGRPGIEIQNIQNRGLYADYNS